MAEISPFRQTYLARNTIITVTDEFEAKYERVRVRSDESERIWEVKLEDYFLTDGWEEFAAAHNLKDGDVLVFRHEGDEFFHVSVELGSVFGNLQNDSRSCVDVGEDNTVENDVDVDVADDDGGEGESDEGNISEEEKDQNPEANSFSFVLRVTRYSLLRDRLELDKDFTFLFNWENKMREIDLKNEQGRRWTMVLVVNNSSGVFYIRRGWENFCCANGLSEGDLCKFKLVEDGEKPVLLLCRQELAVNKSSSREEEECPEADAAVNSWSAGGCKEGKSMSGEGSKGKEKKIPSRFVTFEYTPSRHTSGQLSFPWYFTRANGIKKSVEITLLNRDGRKWLAYLRITGCAGIKRGQCYLSSGWREMCKANGVMVNDSFVLELIWDDATPMLKFCSKIRNPESQFKGSRSTLKKRGPETVPQPKVEARGSKRVTRGSKQQASDEIAAKETSHHTPTTKRSSTNQRKSQQMQPRSCSVSDRVNNLRQSIVDSLTTVKQCRTELETTEHNLEASLMEIDAFGEKILEITKILNNNLD